MPWSITPRRGAAPAALLCLLAVPGLARAEQATICYDYGCYSHAQVRYSDEQLESLRALLAAAADARAERAAISLAIGRMYAIAGEQTPIWRDKGGNWADGGVDGQMDCIDHSTDTTIFLRLLELRGWLRFHEVIEPLERTRFFFSVHWTARVRERDTKLEYAVDSWYFDNGRPAAVMPLSDWLSGKRPDGS